MVVPVMHWNCVTCMCAYIHMWQCMVETRHLKMSQRMFVSELLWKRSDRDVVHLVQQLQIVSVVLKKWYLPPDKKKALEVTFLRQVKQRCLKISAPAKLMLGPSMLTNKGSRPHPEALYLCALSMMLISPGFSPRRSPDVKLLLLCAIGMVLTASCLQMTKLSAPSCSVLFPGGANEDSAWIRQVLEESS